MNRIFEQPMEVIFIDDICYIDEVTREVTDIETDKEFIIDFVIQLKSHPLFGMPRRNGKPKKLLQLHLRNGSIYTVVKDEFMERFNFIRYVKSQE